MQKNLVIVESPAKAKTIQKFLGAEYAVTSSMGHIRDLVDKDFESELSPKYKPKYEVMPDKQKIVSELKKSAKTAEMVWLATDEDREGEAIAWHLADELKLKKENSRRIAFHEITKTAIQKAIETPRELDVNLVDAQQARRVLDKVVGFELSPILWKKIKPSLSAGRVQSVTVRLVVEREREIQTFKSVSSYRVAAIFSVKENGKNSNFKAYLRENLPDKKTAQEFLEKCKTAAFKVENIETTDGKRTPAAPFTTSTLQQEASRKFGFPVAVTMRVAQSLYESGKITYMRTDSVNLSSLALNTAKQEIIELAGEKYYKFRQYQTKSKGAQEAHEAIRPTFINEKEIAGTAQEKKLYELIWKRTLASQMADALLEKTNITVSLSNSSEKFIATGEVIKFDGFLKVYMESKDDETDEKEEGLLPKLSVGQMLEREEITATQTYSKHPFRYSEASLVKKLEELGIGRPSTYATTISTIQARNYVEKKDVAEQKQETNILTLKNSAIKDETKIAKEVADKAKLVPTDIGIVVNDFLIENFPKILNYNFTAEIEQEFDDIAEGKIAWLDNILSFYQKFHPEVIKALNTTGKKAGERALGTDPKSGKTVYAKIGRYGAVVQIGEASNDEKPQFASLQEGQSIETITLNEALELFKLPRVAGEYEGKEMKVAVGRFGPYIAHASKFYSLPKADNPMTVTAERAIEIIEEKRLADKNKMIADFGEIQVLNGRFGAYIKFNAANYKIPKGTEPQTLTAEQCKEIIAAQPETKGKKKFVPRKKK
ncbi:MAG: type I DNA topoisomerase [Prevotellaceae bacterium]|jgi:DNA topoisomerase-1|nr:type I DNA topoisomerase [Prevotellaceae bacterium]